MMSAYLSREKDSMRLYGVVNLELVHPSITIRDIQESVSGTLTHSRRSGASVTASSLTKLSTTGTRGLVVGGHFVKLEELWNPDQLGPAKRVVLWLRLLNSLSF